ncbi:methylaspartate mutase subunit E [Mycoplasmatota bacterium]|nr:methylaspartate mutase subunit E [Mycoplasmatota bacterium]
MELKNKRISEEEFLKMREEVLSSWTTGKDIDIDEAIEYLKKLPDHKNFAKKLYKAKDLDRVLIQPRAGVALVDQHIKLLKYLEKIGRADFLPTTVDSYTRQNRYEEAEIGIRESIRTGKSMLNGFPVVNHGVNSCRRVAESINVPLQARHGTPDARLLTEIIHAAGWTSNEGGGISYNIPYAKNVPLETTIKNWQYCDRLVGYYEERGISLNREPFGPLTGTLVPPCISNTVAIIETLLAAEQGVKNITVGYGQLGNIVQDVAAIRALREQAEYYLNAYGYEDVYVSTVFHQWMGGFPKDETEAFGLISMGATTAALAGATKMITKTTHESIGIPTMQANAKGLKASKEVVMLLRGQKYATGIKIRKEIEQIKTEVDQILDKVLEVGHGDLAVGTVEAFKAGIIDIPFAPSQFNAGKILTARDKSGAVRILEFGNIPFTQEVKDFHYNMLKKRAEKENREVDFNMTIDDVYSISDKKNIIDLENEWWKNENN